VRVSRRISIVAALVVVTVLAGLAALVGSSSSQASPQAAKATYLATLVSDIGKFNDRSFNQSQKEGLDKAQNELGVKTLPLQSNSTSDYIPNLTTAVRKQAALIISAGFLLADATNTVATRNPNLHFAITDYDVTGTPFNGRKNVEGLTYAANESGCLVGYLAAEMAKKQGGKQVIGAVGGLQIPPVDIWIAGYKFCAAKAVPGTKTIVAYSNDFAAVDKCQTVAQNEIGQGAKVLFQVAAGCGLGALKAADAAGLWGIGVDSDQYNDAKRVLTSATKHTDTGVYDTVLQAAAGKFQGGTDLNFNLKNNGVGVGRINPSVPKAWIKIMNGYRAKIIAGTFKVPTALK
jgi:basic membrane protein A